MGIFRVEKVKDYTTISNYHLRDKGLSLKAKGLLTMILALPEDWNFTIRGLSAICKEGVESIGTALKELEKGGYLVRKRVRGADGRMNDIWQSDAHRERAGMPQKLEKAEEWIVELERQTEQVKAELGKPFAQEKELEAKAARLAELNAALNIDEKRKEPMEKRPMKDVLKA